MLEHAADSAEHGGPILISPTPATPQPITRATSPPVTSSAAGTLPYSRRLRNVNHPDGLWIRPGRVLSIR
jgi:hypothetical protein